MRSYIVYENENKFQNYPNFFHSFASIRYTIPIGVGNIPVRMVVYDISGRLVEILVNESKESGVYGVKWEGKDLPSGSYFYRLNVGVYGHTPLQTQTRKMVLLK